MAHKHIHQYMRVRKARRKDAVVWYTCIVVGCTHKERIEFMLNRLCICHRCGEEFVLTKEILYDKKLVKPHCDACTRSDKQTAINEFAKQFAEDL